jgi:diguanylate cyclase (GGDEF)-like protein
MKALRRFKYYGLGAEDYTSVYEDVRQHNYEIVSNIYIWTFITLVTLSMVSLMLSPVRQAQWIYLIFAVITGLFLFIIHLSPSFTRRHVFCFSYVIFFILLAFGIVSSTVHSDSQAVVFPAMIIFVPLLVLHNMVGVGLCTIMTTVVFCIIVRYVKTPTVAYYDIYNAICFTFAGLLVHFLIQRNRMHGLIAMRDSRVLLEKYHSSRKELEIRASYDSLSNLYNRGTFILEMERMLSLSRQGYQVLGILDVDQFKRINDTYGHQTGDKVIIAIAEEISNVLSIRHTAYSYNSDVHPSGIENLAGRLGGDEFIFFITDQPSEKSLVQLLIKLQQQLALTNSDVPEGIQISIGLTVARQYTRSFDVLYHEADKALYQAKADPSQSICFYHSEKSDH